MKPRVVMLSAFLSPRRSGAEACVEEVAKRLADKFEITIVTARLQRNLSRCDALDTNVRIRRVGFGYTWDKWLFPFLAPFAVAELRPQFIHAVLESYAGLAMVICRFCAPVPTVLTCQSTNTSFLLRLMHRHATRVTCISEVLRQRAATLGREDAMLIPNGIDEKAIRSACVRTAKILGRVLFVGRLEQMKGVDVLIQAFATQPASTQLHIVGAGSQRKPLDALVRKLRLEDRVRFLGYMPPPTVYAEFAAAKIFCGLSRSEALGNVFLEAQAAGCAVLATSVGGIPEIVTNGLHGLLVPPDDVTAAAKALRTLLTDASKSQALAEAGKTHAAAYDWQTIADLYEQVYLSALASTGT